MHLVASIRPASDLEAAVEALVASAAMTKAEARMRLAPEPPALLVRLPPEDAVRVVTELGRAGLPALALDEDVPSDSERFQVRSFAFEAGSGQFTSRTGETLAVPWDDVRLVLRGVRTSRTTTEHTETRQKLAPGRAVLTGGLVFTKKTTSTADEALRRIVGAYDDPLVRASGLGPLLQPARTANLGVLTQELRRRAPRAFHDDRLLRLGRRTLPFVLGGNEQRSSTRGSVDVLAAVLDQAVRTGLLP